MTKTKSTKRALLLSALSLLMCVSMLIGSTFAWFTDSVTSGGNKIKAGTLEIQLLMDADLDGKYDDISDSNAPIFGAGSIAQNNNAETLWEPGKTQVAYLAIKNNGNLALKYTVGLNVQNISKDLYEVMEYAIIADADKDNPVTSWTSGNSVVVGTQSVSGDVSLAVGATHYFALAIHMDEEAGNDYQGGEVDFDLTIMATQDTVESDSFNNQYDKDAMYAVANDLYIDEEDGSYVAMSTEGLSSVAALASKDSSITSVKYVTDAGEVEVPIASDDSALDTAIEASNKIVVLTDGNYIIPDSASGKTLTFVGTGDTVVATQDDGSYEGCDYSLLSSNVTFEGIVINTDSSTYTGYAGLKATYNNCTINGAYWLYGESEFNNCTFNVSGDNYNIWTWGAGTATFNGCTFNTDGKSILVYTSSCDVYVNDCIFNDRTNGTGFTKSAIETGADDKVNTKHNIYITNTTVNGFAENDKCVGYENVVGNKDSLTKDNLNIVIDRVDVY